MYRAGIHALMFCGCVGKNGGGLAHYVGQEKLAPMESWSSIALAKDWFPPSRLQNTPSWHYVHSDQWRYEKDFTDYHTVPAKRRARHARPRATRWTCRCAPCARAGCRSIRSSPRTPSTSREAARASRRRRRPEDVASQWVAESTEERQASCNSRSKTPTRKRTGRACGSSGAATR